MESFRLALSPMQSAGGIHELTLVADLESPAPVGLCGFHARILLPPSLSLSSWSIEDTDLSAALGGAAPFHLQVTSGDGAVSVIAVLSPDRSLAVPYGSGRSLVRLELSAQGESAPDLSGAAILADEWTPAVTLTDGRTLRASSSGPPSPAAPPSGGSEAGALSGDPGEPELLSGEGSGASFGAGLGASSEECAFTIFEFTPPIEPEPELLVVTATEERIRSALTTPPPPGTARIIQVLDPGSPTTVTLSSTLEIDSDLFPDGLYFFSQGGPEAVILDGSGIPGFGGSVLRVTDTLPGGGGTIRIGGAIDDSTDPADWLGFTIVNGTSADGGGIHLDEVRVPVEILGNIVGLPGQPNRAAFRGGGIAAIGCSDVTIVYNRISSNVYGFDQGDVVCSGGGVAAVLFDTSGPGTEFFRLIRNELIENIAHDSPVPSTTYQDRQGGGVYVFAPRKADVRICSNRVAENTGTIGCGIRADVIPPSSGLGPPGPVVRIEGNRVEENSPFLLGIGDICNASYQGGGVHITTGDGDFYDIDVLNNSVSQNSIVVPTGLPTAVSPPVEVGGGMFLSAVFQNAANPQATNFRVHGNAVYLNAAASQGGGIYYRNSTPPAKAAEFFNNTVVGNGVANVTGAQGIGAYFAEDSRFRWSSGVLAGNGPPFATDWFAEPPLVAGGLENTQTTTLVAPPGSALLCSVGPTGCRDSNSALVIDLDHVKVERKVSECIDWGDDTLVLQIQEDLDAEPRSLDIIAAGGASVLDRGSDEFTIRFVRGDANGDNAYNLADVIFIFGVVTGSLVPRNCRDALDADDDGDIDFADGMYVLDSMSIPPGPLPPAPHPACGFDPTEDGLAPCVDAAPASTPCP